MASVFKSAVAQNVGTTSATVYTTPALTTTTAIGMSLCNVGTQVILADVTITKGSTTVHLLKNVPIPTGSTVVVIGGDQKVVLNTSDVLSVRSNTASQLDAILSVLELS